MKPLLRRLAPGKAIPRTRGDEPVCGIAGGLT